MVKKEEKKKNVPFQKVKLLSSKFERRLIHDFEKDEEIKEMVKQKPMLRMEHSQE